MTIDNAFGYNLESHLLEKIFLNMQINDLVQVSATCKIFYKTIFSSDFASKMIKKLSIMELLPGTFFLGRNLNKIKLSYNGTKCNLNDSQVKILVKRCPKTENLDLSYFDGITDQALEEVAKLKILKKLTLKNCDNITDLGLKQLKTHPTLEICNFERCAKVFENGKNYLKLKSRLDFRITCGGFIGYEY